MTPLYTFRFRYRELDFHGQPEGDIKVAWAEGDDEASATKALEAKDGMTVGVDIDVIDADNEGPGRIRRLAKRIASGQCAVIEDWCLTHNTDMNPGHAHDINPARSLD